MKIALNSSKYLNENSWISIDFFSYPQLRNKFGSFKRTNFSVKSLTLSSFKRNKTNKVAKFEFVVSMFYIKRKLFSPYRIGYVSFCEERNIGCLYTGLLQDIDDLEDTEKSLNFEKLLENLEKSWSFEKIAWNFEVASISNS